MSREAAEAFGVIAVFAILIIGLGVIAPAREE